MSAFPDREALLASWHGTLEYRSVITMQAEASPILSRRVSRRAQQSQSWAHTVPHLWSERLDTGGFGEYVFIKDNK